MKTVLVSLLLLLAVALPTNAANKPPPLGPWKGSTGSREGLHLRARITAARGGGAAAAALDKRPLVEQCKLRWHETRLDHFS